MANINADVLRVCNTEANLLTTLREKQHGFATDTHRTVFKAPGGTFYYYHASGDDASFASVTATDGQFIYDTDNLLEITSTYAFLKSNGEKILDYLHSNGYMALNADAADIDVDINGTDPSVPVVHVDAGLNSVGINTIVPRAGLHVGKATAGTAALLMLGDTTNNTAKITRILSQMYASDAAPEGFVALRTSVPDANTNIVSLGGGSGTYYPSSQIDFYTNPSIASKSAGVVRLQIDKDGNIVINETGLAVDTRIEGDTDANLFVTDGSADRVGIGVATPAEKLDVNGNIKCTDIVTTTYASVNAAINSAQNTADNAVGDAATAQSSANLALTRADVGLNRTTSGTSYNGTDAIITPPKKILTDGSAVSLFEVALPNSGDTCGGMFSYRIHCWNGTDFQSHCGVANFAAGNKAGTITSAIGHSSGVGGLETEIESSGTLTDTFAITNGTGKITITLNANSSLTPSANQLYVNYTLHNDSDQTVTIL